MNLRSSLHLMLAGFIFVSAINTGKMICNTELVADSSETTGLPMCNELGPDVYFFVVHNDGTVLVAQQGSRKNGDLVFYRFKECVPTQVSADTIDVSSTANEITRIHSHDVVFAQSKWSPSGYNLAVVTKNDTIEIYQVVSSVDAHGQPQEGVTRIDTRSMNAPVRSFAWSNDGDYLAVVTDSHIHVLLLSREVEHGKLEEVASLEHSAEQITDIKWAANDLYLSISGDTFIGICRVKKQDGISLKIIDSYQAESHVKSTSWGKNGNILAVLLESKLILLYVTDFGISTSKTQQSFVLPKSAVLAWCDPKDRESRLIVSNIDGDYQKYVLDSKGRLRFDIGTRSFLNLFSDSYEEIPENVAIALVNQIVQQSVLA